MAEALVVELAGAPSWRRPGDLVTWHRLPSGPHAGETLPQVMFEAPDYVLDGVEAGKFDGSVLVEALEVRRRAARIRVPRDVCEEQEVVVLYHLLPDRSFGGFVIVAKSDPGLAEYKRFSAARSDGLDVTMPRRIAPGDRTATKGMLEGVLFQLFGDPHRRVTPRECVAFFDDADNFLE